MLEGAFMQEYTIQQTGQKEGDVFLLKKKPHLNVFKDEYEFVMIDDKKKDMDLFEIVLREETQIPFRLVRFLNINDGLRALEKQIVKPDLIILDLVMPGMNGNMVLKRLKISLQTKHIPVVIHSSMSYYGNIQNVAHLDAHAFFPKPIQPEAFEQFIMGSMDTVSQYN